MLNHDYVHLDFDELPVQDNGVLPVLANLTRTGVFTYFQKDPDGTVRIIRQLRHPEEVFAEETMKTLMGLPATNNHPSEMEVNPDNVSDYIVGMTSDTPKRVLAPVQGDKEEYVQQLVTFFDRKTINDMVNNGKRELSLGYECYLDEAPGEWNGQKYDVIQRDIRYNHLSVVDRGRAGASCRVLLDSQSDEVKKQLNTVCDGLTFIEDAGSAPDGQNKESVSMKILIIDGVEHKVSEEVYEAYTNAKKSLSDLKTQVDSKQVDLDKLQASNDELTEKLKAKNNDADGEFQKLVAERVKLISKGIQVLGDSEDLSPLSEREIKERCIKAIRKDVNLNDKSDAYVDARFDVAMEDFKPKQRSNDSDLGKGRLNNDGKNEDSYEAKRKAAWLRDKELYKQPFGKKA